MDREFVQGHLCQRCLDILNAAEVQQQKLAVYVLVDMDRQTIQPLVQGRDWLYMGDFRIGCAFEWDGTIKLLIRDTVLSCQ